MSSTRKSVKFEFDFKLGPPGPAGAARLSQCGTVRRPLMMHARPGALAPLSQSPTIATLTGREFKLTANESSRPSLLISHHGVSGNLNSESGARA